MAGTSFAEILLTETEKLFEPLAEINDTPARLEEFLQTLFPDASSAEVAAIAADVDELLDAVESFSQRPAPEGEVAFDELLVLLADLRSIFTQLSQFPSSATTTADVSWGILDRLLTVYLQREHPLMLYVGVLLTLVAYPVEGESTDLPKNGPLAYAVAARSEVRIERLSDVLARPVDAVREGHVTSPPTSSEISRLERLVFPLVTVIARFVGLDGYRIVPEETTFDAAPEFTAPARTWAVYREIAGEPVRVGRVAVGTKDGTLSLLFQPTGDLNVDFETQDWTLGFVLETTLSIVVLSQSGIEMGDPPDGQLDATLDISKSPDPETGKAVSIGPSDGTRLELGAVGFESSVSLDSAESELDLRFTAADSKVTVAPGNGDGFVAKVLPDDGLGVDFDAGIGWGTTRGIYFQGGAGLETDIGVSLSLGDVLTIDSVHLGAKPSPAGTSMSIPVEVSTSPQVQLGPVGATVERIGLEADLTFPEDRDGNLGPVDVDLQFKPPSGAGLSVDASAVVGGGYLSFDPENERYSGTLQLQIGSLTLKAVGLLTTRFPDGRDGFSLLVIITGEFPPVQLGFGFTLDGLGGLLGINRGTKVEALRAGLRDGTTKSVLFPTDPMRNAPRIVSDLRRVFPPTSGRHVFGPMAKLGWGTPTIMTAEIGVLVSLPAPVTLVLLGRLHAALPDDEAALLVFNMDAIGVVDFGAKEASIDATLYDSRIVAYTLTGDMAMRTSWGADPDFALSVGGFHPKFDPPEGFPDLRRIALTLGPGNPRIRWSGYFAITSNTVQAGAKVELYAAAAGFSVSGHLGFDALFQFDPFKLLVDIAAGFAIKRGGTTLLSAQLKGSLKGPNPWHVRGRASFEIWPLSFSVNVDATFGDRRDPEPLPPADVLGQVTAALGDERNWSAQLPENGESAVTLREIERESGTVLAHPLGTLAVRQQVAPLGVTIEKFGNATPATYTKYTISSVHVAGQSQSVDGTDSREQFAPAQFFELSDDEKLQRPSFERYPAGTAVGNTLFAHGGMEPGDGHQVRTTELAYETSLVDEQASPFSIDWKRLAMPTATAAALTEVSAVARGPLRTTGAAKFAGTDDASGPTGVDASVSVSDTAYVVARASDLRQVAVPDVPSDGTTRRETAEALDAFVAAGDRDAGAYRVVASHEAAGPEVSP